MYEIARLCCKRVWHARFRVDNSIIFENRCDLCFIVESALYRSFEIRRWRERRFRWRPDWRRSEIAGGIWVGGQFSIVTELLRDCLGESDKIWANCWLV